MIDPAYNLVSEATEDRVGRALFELRRASQEYFAALDAREAEAYAAAECADARAAVEPED